MINRVTYAVALLGVILTLHLWTLKARGFEQGCLGFADSAGAAASSECEEVITSESGTFLGVDNIILGFIFYVAVGALSLAQTFSGSSRRKLLRKGLLGLTACGFFLSLYFVFMMLFVLKATCPLCLTSALFITVLFGLQIWQTLKDPAGSELSAEGALRELGVIVVVSFLAGALLVADTFFVNKVGVFSLSDNAHADEVRALAASVLEDQIDAQYLKAMAPCSYADDFEPVQNFRSLVTASDPSTGNQNSPVIVLEVFDPNCPHCKRLHPIMQEVTAKYKDRAAFYFKPFPLWSYSVEQVQAIWLAARSHKAFEMIEAQFARQRSGGLSRKELSAIAAEIGLDIPAFEKGLSDAGVRQQVLQFKEELRNAGIHSAPKLLINGRLVGSKGQTLTETCIGRLLEQELGKS